MKFFTKHSLISSKKRKKLKIRHKVVSIYVQLKWYNFIIFYKNYFKYFFCFKALKFIKKIFNEKKESNSRSVVF